MITKLRSKGVAVITALLIVAITTIAATNLSSDNALDFRRTSMLLYHEQAREVASGAESWVRNILRDDSIDSQTDHLGELWASDLPALPVDNGSVQGAVTGQIFDLQGRFNVNNLIAANGEVDQVVLEQYRRLLAALGIDLRFAGLTVDWIDADRDASIPDGAEDGIYTGLLPPYRTYNRQLSNITELAALDGMTQSVFAVLSPHIAALPPYTAINVNTATAPVLQSLGENLDAGTAQSLIELREGVGFADIQTVFSPYVDPALSDRIGDTSAYFQLKAIVQIDTVRLTYFSTLARQPQGGPVTVLLRSHGTI